MPPPQQTRDHSCRRGSQISADDHASAPSAIFYFSSRDIDRDFRDYDFRYPLVEAWRRRGVATYYIRLRRRPLVSEALSSDRLTEIPLLALPRLIRAKLREAGARSSRPVYFDTTCLNFPWTILALKIVLPPGLWCYDLHDDYVYLAQGWRKQARALQQRVLAWTADVTVRAAATLTELVPSAIALGNASQVAPIPRPATDFTGILIIGSIDERYDFDMLASIAALAPDLHFDLWGQVSQNRREPRDRLAAVLGAHANIRHFGRYDPGQVASILARYGVALAPYRTGIRLTRYIDPLRYYDCLNSGMELITTDIPMARSFADALHVAGSARDVVDILRRIGRDPTARRNLPEHYRPITWDDRAGRFLDMCRERIVGASRPGDRRHGPCNGPSPPLRFPP